LKTNSDADLPTRPISHQDTVDVTVIGAGWAGLSAAVHCTLAGKRVRLIDAAPQAGGRARHQAITFDSDHTVVLDNGQHLLIGAYTESIDLFALVNGERMDQMPITLNTETGMTVNSPFVSSSPTTRKLLKWLPALLVRGIGFLTATGLSWGEKFAVVKFLGVINLKGWNNACLSNENVEQLLQRFNQSKQLQSRLWNPLCIATMNTVPAIADASTFCRVLRDSLGSPVHAASDFLTPQTHLGAALPEPALKWLAEKGCDIQLRTSVNALSRATDGSWLINENLSSKQIILAIPPSNAFKLLKPLVKPGSAVAVIEQFNQFLFQPIATVYLAWKSKNGDRSPLVIPLPKIFMLDENRPAGRPGQWLFNRGLHVAGPGLLHVAAVVVSAWDLEQSIEQLGTNVKAQVASIQALPLPEADCVKVIIEKRATIACTADRPKISSDALAQTPELSGIWLAGDYTYFDYPATLEGAVRSGKISAGLAIRTLGNN
jgi:hydroxysqualene dehydroxylase